MFLLIEPIYNDSLKSKKYVKDKVNNQKKNKTDSLLYTALILRGKP